MVSNLHSTAIAHYSLVEVLRHAEAEFRSGPSPILDLACKGEPRQVHPLIRDEVYRICREALANAFRHANAEYVTVEVRFLPDVLEVEISDDGQGMTEELLKHGRAGHFGLRGMQAHAQRIGATLTVESEPGQGTNVILRVKTSNSFWRNKKRRLGTRDNPNAG
jgi:signal transduction histidine kinase